MSHTSVQPTDRRFHRHRYRRGNAVLETTVAMSLLLSLTLGSIEFGYCIYMRHVVQMASVAGARAAVLSTSTQSRVTSAITNSMSSAGFGSSGFGCGA